MDSLTKRTLDATNAAVRSLEVRRAFHRINYELFDDKKEPIDKQRVLFDLETKAKSSQFDDPALIGKAFVAWTSGYNLNTAADLLNVPVPMVKGIWDAARLPTLPIPKSQYPNQEFLVEQAVRNAGSLVNVTLGTTPTGMPSLANMYTFALGINKVKKCANASGKLVKVTFGVNDHLVQNIPLDIKEARSRALDEVIADLQNTFEIEVSRLNASDMQSLPEYRSLLQRAAQKNMFHNNELQGDLAIWSPCKDSNHRDWISASKANARRDYITSTDQIYGGLATTVLLRNTVTKSNLHVVGGDDNHAMLLQGVSNRFGIPSPAVLVTGIVYGPDGKEMHASGNNTFLKGDFLSPRTWAKDLSDITSRPDGNLGALEYQHLLTDEAKQRIYQ